MANFYVMDDIRQQLRQWLSFKGSVRKLTVDYSSWADDNGNATSATWTVESGNATISSETLSNNVASALITTSEHGWSMITVSVTDGTHTNVIYIEVLAKDPRANLISDYWAWDQWC